MKICVVTHSLIKGDGQGRVNYEVVFEALRHGHQITILASQLDSELEQNQLLDWVYIPVKHLPTELIRNLAFSWQSSKWIKTNRSKFDIVKINGAITNASADFNAVHFVHSSWLKSPVHIWQQRKNAYSFYQLLYTFLNAYWEKQAFARADKIVAVSQQVRRELVDIGVSDDQIDVITNGVDLQEFAPGKGNRLSLKLPENVPLAFFAGDIRTPRKNLDTILKALAKVPDLHLAIAGSTEGSPYLELAKDLDLGQRTHFLGYRTDVSELMKAVDMFVFPSRYEACSLVLLEAIASGLPVITATTTGGSEVITPECGILLNSTENVEELAKALKSLTSDRNLRIQMSQAARIIAEQHSWTSMANKYLHLFKALNK